MHEKDRGAVSMSMSALIPSAQYVRMSTEDQQYSIANQKDAIAGYAAQNGYCVIATYADEGKSGLAIKSRPALRKLLDDVVSGRAQFEAILVYDVSRWGRFQDVDEAAHYEFICKLTGIPVRYCAEQFVNDVTMPSSLMKTIKRIMAAEYSRELGVKVFAGQVRLAQMGFRVAGGPGLGLRRMMVTVTGQRRMILKTGDHKAIKTDHVILVPGPKKEVAIVREAFRMACKRRNTPKYIAQELNSRGMWIEDYGRWTSESIWRLLKNEKYIGSNVFGKTTQKLGMPTRTLPRDKWTVIPGAFAPIIDLRVFQKAQQNIRSRSHAIRTPDEFFLNRLRRTLARHGKITQRLVGIHSDVFAERFGSAREAYRLVGYEPSEHAFKSIENQTRAYRLRLRVIEELRKTYPATLQVIRLPGQSNRQVLEFDHHVRVAVHICGQVRRTTVTHEPRWLLKAQPLEAGYPALICLPDASLDRIVHFYLVPEFSHLISHYKVLKLNHKWFAAGRRLENLGELRAEAIHMSGRWQEIDDTSKIGDVVISVRSSTITIAGQTISLPPIQAEIFKILLLNSGSVVSRTSLKHPFTESQFPSEQLNAHIADLRKRLGPTFRERIKTVVGRGYKYEFSEESRLSRGTLGISLFSVP